MEGIVVPKEVFSKIIADVETLIDDVEIALDEKVRKRLAEIENGKVKCKSEDGYYEYLKSRGIKIARVHN